MSKKGTIAVAVITALLIAGVVSAQGNLTQPVTITAGNGLTKTGNTLNVGATVGGGLTVGADSIGLSTACGSGEVLQWDGDSWECGVGGITMSAGANVIPKSDGTNLVASSWTDAAGVSTTTGDIELNNDSADLYVHGNLTSVLRFSAAGTGAPTLTTRSAGAKIVLYPSLSGTNVDYGMGIDTGTFWQSIREATVSTQFKWYGGTTELMRLRGDGLLTLNGAALLNSNVTMSNAGSSTFTINADTDNATETDVATILLTQDNAASKGLFGLDSSGGNDLVIGAANSAFTDIHFALRSDSTTPSVTDAKVTIENDGSVCVGTTTCTSTFHVAGTASTSGETRIGSPGSAPGFYLAGSETADQQRLTFEASDGADRFWFETDLDGVNANDLLVVRSTNVDNVVALKGDGNVGFGASNPASLVSLSGAGASTTLTAHDPKATLRIHNSDTTTGNYTNIVFGATARAAISVKNVDQTNNYAEITLATRSASGFLANLTLGADQKVTAHKNLDVAGNLTSGDSAGDVFDHNGTLAKFGNASDGRTYIVEDAIGFEYDTDADADGWINYRGYNYGTTRFRNLNIGDGKAGVVCTFAGSTKILNCIGGLQVNGTSVATTSNISGSANTLAMFTGANTVGDAPITYDGANILTTTKQITISRGAAQAPQINFAQTGQKTWAIYEPASSDTLNIWNSTAGDVAVWDGAGALTANYGVTTPANLTTTGTGDLVVADAATIGGDLVAGTTTANINTINGKLTIASPGGTVIIGNSSSEVFRTPVSKTAILGTSVFNYQLDGNKTFIRGGAVSSDVVIGDTATTGAVQIASATAMTNVLGAANITGTIDVNNDLAKFGGTIDGGVYFTGGPTGTNSLNFEYGTAAIATGYINRVANAGATGTFRNLVIADGKTNAIATFTGSTLATTFAGAVTVTGTLTSNGSLIASGSGSVANYFTMGTAYGETNGFACARTTNADATCHINKVSYNNNSGPTRNLQINDGTGDVLGTDSIAYFSGSTKQTTLYGILDVNSNISKFGSTVDGSAYISGGSANEGALNFDYATNAAASGWINRLGYQASASQFRNLIVGDGKGASIATFLGSDKSVTFNGNLIVNSDDLIVDTTTHEVEAANMYVRGEMKYKRAGTTYYEWHDDYFSTKPQSGASGTSTEYIGGEMEYISGAIGSSTTSATISSLITSDAVDGHPGIVRFDTGSTSTGNLYRVTDRTMKVGGANTTHTYEAVVRFPVLSDVGANAYLATVGFISTPTGNSGGNGCWFAYDANNVTGDNSTNAHKFMCGCDNPQSLTTERYMMDGSTVSSGSFTTVDAPVVAGDWYTLRVDVSDTMAEFYVDDVKSCQIDNMPTGQFSAAGYAMKKLVSTTAVQMDIDYTRLTMTIPAR